MQKTPSPRVFIAVDTPDADRARTMAALLAHTGCGLKLGLEFFTAQGPQGVRILRQEFPDLPVFLDLKFHDIPNTVAQAVRAVVPLDVSYLNVHATGGAEMMRAAADAARDEAGKHGVPVPVMLAVTVLTSLDDSALTTTGQHGPAATQVGRLARLAEESGMAGVVCSAHEIALLRANCGPDFVLMVPGIRPAGSTAGDQKRTMTPAQAITAGATHLVIGRPVTQATDPERTLRDILCEIDRL